MAATTGARGDQALDRAGVSGLRRSQLPPERHLPHAAFSDTRPQLFTVSPCDYRTRSFPDQLKARRAVVLKLSAASTHWLLQNPTVLTVALAHWSLPWKGASLPGTILRSHESVAAQLAGEFPNSPPGARVPIPERSAAGGACAACQSSASANRLTSLWVGPSSWWGSESLRTATPKPGCG